jgi:hypothetical protein
VALFWIDLIQLSTKLHVIAQVAELVDALASGASDFRVVEVQVLFWAPIMSKG